MWDLKAIILLDHRPPKEEENNNGKEVKNSKIPTTGKSHKPRTCLYHSKSTPSYAPSVLTNAIKSRNLQINQSEQLKLQITFILALLFK